MIKISKHSIYIVFVMATAFGCKVGESYKRPDLKESEDFYGVTNAYDSAISGAESLSEIGWKQYFKDSTLLALIDTALANNLDMQKAVHQVEIGYQGLQQSKANFYPTLGFSPMDFTREYYSENYNNYGSNRSRKNHGDNPPSTLYTEKLAYVAGLFSSWELDIWGKYKWKKEAAQAAYMQSKEFEKAVQTALVAEIASVYYNMLLVNAQIEIARQNLDLGERTLKIVKLQFDADETTSLAIQQTKSQTLRAKSLIPKLEKQYVVLENRLNQLLGRYPQHIDIVSELDEVSFDESYNTGVPVELIGNRPDIAASEYQLVISNANVGITQAMRYPSIKLTAGAGLNSYQIDNFLDPMGSGFALINGAIFQPVFQNRKLKTNYEVAVKQREIAILDFKDNFIQAVGEVSDALVTIEKLNEEYDIARERFEVTTKGVKDASMLFESGFANYLEVINAQEDALETQLEVADLKRQLLLANIELYRSLGGGWK